MRGELSRRRRWVHQLGEPLELVKDDEVRLERLDARRGEDAPQPRDEARAPGPPRFEPEATLRSKRVDQLAELAEEAVSFSP